MTSVFKNACVKIRTVAYRQKKIAKNVFFEDNNSRHQFCKENLECPLQSNTFRKKKSCPSVTDAVALPKKPFSVGITPRIRIFKLLRYWYRYCIMNTNSLLRRGSLPKLESIFLVVETNTRH
jgi:hypothetical protein